MTNRELIACAIANGVADKDRLLAYVLAGECALRPVRKKGEWKSAAGWVCTACMLGVLLFGYFNRNITIGIKDDCEFEQTGAASSAVGDLLFSETQADLPEMEQPAPVERQEKLSLPEFEQMALPHAQGEPAQDGWVHTNDEVTVTEKPYEPELETDTSDGSGGSNSTTKPPKPDNEGGGNLGDGELTNPDTGGGSSLLEVPYLRFCTDASYSEYWGYIPRDLLGYAYLPFVSYTPAEDLTPATAELSYGNPNGLTKQVYNIMVGGILTSAPQITTPAQITEAMLKSLNAFEPQADPKTMLVSVELTIRNKPVHFSSRNVSYQEAVQVLQSLPALNGGITP